MPNKDFLCPLDLGKSKNGFSSLTQKSQVGHKRLDAIF